MITAKGLSKMGALPILVFYLLLLAETKSFEAPTIDKPKTWAKRERLK